MKKLSAFGYAIADLSSDDRTAMFTLFADYYSNVNAEQFQKDLESKDHVFVLKDSKSHEIKGFSTIVSLTTHVNGQEIRGLFSGDTVVHHDYWGQGTLGVAFLKYLFVQKLKKPTQPLYWFLISKGYKTYLLMANNFKTHYPRFETDTPGDIKQIIDHFAQTLYPQHYDAQKGIIQFSDQHANFKDCLKADVTPITDDLLASNQRIAYFASQNRRWQQGDELACVAEMTFSMPIYYQLKIMRKMWRRSLLRLGFGKKPGREAELR